MTVLEMGTNNFAAVVLLDGRGLSIAGAHVNPAAVDVFPVGPRGGPDAAAAPAAALAVAPAAAAAAAATGTLGALTVKIDMSITSDR